MAFFLWQPKLTNTQNPEFSINKTWIEHMKLKTSSQCELTTNECKRSDLLQSLLDTG